MLKLNDLDNQKVYCPYNLNTSHVKVKLSCSPISVSNVLHLNTSHVKVKPTFANSIKRQMANLNTSHVKVKQSKIRKRWGHY